MAKGDKIVAMIDTGSGTVEKTYRADKAGQTVEYDIDKKTGSYEIIIRGRAGTPAKTANLRGDRVISIEEVPA